MPEDWRKGKSKRLVRWIQRRNNALREAKAEKARWVELNEPDEARAAFLAALLAKKGIKHES